MSQLTFFESDCPRTKNSSLRRNDGYGRARLWLGITAVGTIVSVVGFGLICDVSGIYERLTLFFQWGPEVSLLVFTMIYATVQLPFDIIGGYVLPRRFNRVHPPLLEFLLGLFRGVSVHVLTLFVTATAINLAGRFGGSPLIVATSFIMIWLLLLGRLKLASLIASLHSKHAGNQPPATAGRMPIDYVENDDEGFTGGVAGVFTPTRIIIPLKWCELLNSAELDFAFKRRLIAIESGSWRRGRAAAIGFTLAGVTIAAFLAGQDRLGTVAGTIDLSFWFTLWSFIGLLILPTVSRHAVIAIDQLACVDGTTSDVLTSTTQRLDKLQDGEEQRPGLVEAIFHPIPSVEKRLRRLSTSRHQGSWDAARTTVYLSLSGLGLLSRAVHCNCGRPSLWVFLPVD